ncbi:pilus assembly protein CpaB [Promicromonospora umidemergens]|uniref:Flp pilus assembly protein CpaB n=1 Tax=Promicromonospora umidemergens TaxID=629679 RepID=A0ABP8XDL2_9MICO|nr:Flp pilus assembly protein CpaB [Promicromonospora umidemergens]MCP2283123.1 pilus assembly protein CpaB [Promicromonospora umidemergens]
MNPRQRRGTFFLVVTSILAVAVFVGVLSYVRTVSSQVGPVVTVLQLNRSVDALESIDESMLDEVEMPERWVPETAVRDAEDADGLVAATAYEEGSMLQGGMLIERPGVQPGFREVAILVDAETGVAGKVEPGDHVDIIATMGGGAGAKAVSRVWVSNVLVLEVGLPQDVEDPDGLATTSGLPVTFALSTEDALTLAYVESFSVKMRLALRGAGDEDMLPAEQRVYDGAAPKGGE